MASFFDSRIFSQLAGTANEVNRERTRQYDEQFRKSGGEALDVGQQLLSLFEQLPAALIASERAEYERLTRSYGKDHPRVTDAREILAGLETFESQAALGRTRVRRTVESMTAPGLAFFGFVHDETGKPLGGLTVRLSSAGRKAMLQARTAEDGYFRIPLVQDQRAPAAARKRASSSTRKAEAAPQPEERAAENGVTVDILDERGTVVHEDPVPLAPPTPAEAEGVDAKLNWVRFSDSIYREYRIEPLEKKPRPAPKPAPARKR